MSAAVARAIVVGGAGRYADPWHPFTDTSAALAELATEAGLDAVIATDVDAALAMIDADLAILNIGNPSSPDKAADAAVRAGILAHVAAGMPILAVHSTSTSLLGMPEWEAIEGGRWVRGTTMHPAYDVARIRIAAAPHPITAGLADFDVADERYSFLRVAADSTVLLTQLHDGTDHPVFWTTAYGSARVAYDGLGHDAASYRAPTHREILRRTIRWLVE